MPPKINIDTVIDSVYLDGIKITGFEATSIKTIENVTDLSENHFVLSEINCSKPMTFTCQATLDELAESLKPIPGTGYYYTTHREQIRKHHKTRINKKWRKYGYKVYKRRYDVKYCNPIQHTLTEKEVSYEAMLEYIGEEVSYEY